MPACDSANKSPRTWWPCGSGRTCAWPWSAHPSTRAGRKPPRTPQDLTEHNCINLRLPTAGGFYAWEFEKGDRELRVRVEGRLAFNTATMAVRAAVAGDGLAFVPEDRVQEHIRAGRLIRALADWCPPFPGFHLYYPSRRQPTPAFAVLVDALRYRDRWD